MRYEELLEHYVNVRTRPDMERYAERVLELINIAYAPIGGHVNFQTPQDLYECPFWKLVRRQGEIVAACLYKHVHGRKRVGIGHDGTRFAKEELKRITAEDIKLQRCWAEVSGAAANYYVKLGVPPVPNDLAAQLLNKEILAKHGRFKYDRILAGHVHTKMIVGFPDGEHYTIGPWSLDEVLF